MRQRPAGQVPAVATAAELIVRSPVARALGVIGDRWTLLILRDAFQGAHRFEEFCRLSGAPRSTLASRLAWLVESGLLERVRYSQSPPRFEYRLTARGRDLHGTTLVIWRWEHRWAPRTAGIPVYLRHEGCGQAMQPEVSCAACHGRVEIQDVSYRVADDGTRPSAGAPRFRRLSSVTAGNHRGANPAFVHATDIIGDRWTPLILSAAFFGMRRFDALQGGLGIATNILAHRLNLLVEQGILERVRDAAEPARFEYCLTQKGRDLFPLALTLMQWGDRWLAPPSGSGLSLFHEPCGARLEPVLTCSACQRPLGPRDVGFPPPGARPMQAPPARQRVRAKAGLRRSV